MLRLRGRSSGGVLNRRRRVGWKRVFAAVSLAFCMVAGVPVVDGAASRVAPDIDTGLVAAASAAEGDSDGCSKVPNSVWLLYSFYDACVAHDVCYVSDSVFRPTRGRCDWDFLEAMQDDCNSRWWALTGCYFVACVYYNGVRIYGEPSYENRSVNTPISYILRETVKQLNPYLTDLTDVDVFDLLSAYYSVGPTKATELLAEFLAACATRPSDYFGGLLCACLDRRGIAVA